MGFNCWCAETFCTKAPVTHSETCSVRNHLNILEDRSVITFSARFATGVWPRGRHVTLDHRSFQTTGRVYVNKVSIFPQRHGVWPCLADDRRWSCRPLKWHYCFVCFFRQLMMKVYIIMCKSFGHYIATPSDSLRGNMIQTVKLP